MAGLRMLAGAPPRWRVVALAVGLICLVLTCTGPVADRAQHSYAWWVGQGLALMLVVPVPLVLGQPGRALGMRPRRWWVPGPILSAAIVPVAAAVFFFGPVPGWAAGNTLAGLAVQAALLAIGLLVAASLLPSVDRLTSAAIGLALAVGVIELLLDAVPGIVMRLSTHPVSDWYSRARPFSLADQQNAGAWLWSVAELVDLPFLVLLALRWMRADAREAAVADRAAELAAADSAAEPPTDPERPWFLDDPRLRDRFR